MLQKNPPGQVVQAPKAPVVQQVPPSGRAASAAPLVNGHAEQLPAWQHSAAPIPLVLSLLQGVHEDEPLAENVLPGQRAQKVAPRAGAYDPLTQGKQTLEPVRGLYVPTGQGRHAVEALLGLYVPAAQATQAVKPGAAEKKPGAQALQAARPAWEFAVPFGQGKQREPSLGLYLPGAQLEQEPKPLSALVPALQFVQLVAAKRLYFPAAHTVQEKDPAPE